MILELRQYRIFPGKRDEWVKFMEERLIPSVVAFGVVVVGSFISQDDEDVYIWIRRFEDEAHLEAYRTTYFAMDEWTNELLPRVQEMLDAPRMLVTRIEPTAKSVIR